MKNIPQPPPFPPRQNLPPAIVIPPKNLTSPKKPQKPIKFDFKWLAIIGLCVILFAYFMFTKTTQTVEVGIGQYSFKGPSRAEKLVKTIQEQVAQPLNWSPAQEAVRKHTGLPYDQILAPIQFHRVLIWCGPPGDSDFSLDTYQQSYPPEKASRTCWMKPEGKGTLVVGIHGDPNSPTPQTKTAYLVDDGGKIRKEYDETFVFIDNKRIDDKSPISFSR